MSWVLFFDGECVFCSRSVRWVARLDRRGRIAFAPLQGRLGRELGLERLAGLSQDATVVVLRESDGQQFFFSDAVLEVTRALGGGWRIFGIFRWIPKRLRDAVYRWISKNRYRIAGKAEACALPDPELVARMRE